LFRKPYMSTIENTYIRFLNCIEELEAKSCEKKLDAIEERLLNAVMISVSQERELLIGDLLALSSVASQATLHGRVKNLIKAGYVKLIADSVDGRKKKVMPTKLAIQYYDKLSKLLAKAVSL
jgi:DNA-binding MarR family transcriptional regulator